MPVGWLPQLPRHASWCRIVPPYALHGSGSCRVPKSSLSLLNPPDAELVQYIRIRNGHGRLLYVRITSRSAWQFEKQVTADCWGSVIEVNDNLRIFHPCFHSRGELVRV